MNWFRRLSLRRQLAVVITLGSCGALLVMMLASATYELIRFRHETVRELTLAADLVGRDALTAIADDNAADARATLAHLAAEPRFLTARIFLPDGRLLAEYVRPGVVLPALPNRATEPEFRLRYVRLCRPIVCDGQEFGTLCVRAETWPSVARAATHLGILLLVALGSLAVATGLAAWLQRLVSQPVAELVQATRAVAEQSDFTHRVAPEGTAELAELAEAFNQMLAKLNARDQALRLANLELEQSGRQLQEELVERQRAEVTLRDHKARLGVLLAQVPAVLWTTDRELRFTSSMGAGLSQMGLKPDAVVGQSLPEFFQSADPQLPAVLAHQRALRGQTIHFEQQWGGRQFESQVEPLFNERREIIGCIGVALDVTDRVQAEQQLLEISDREQHRLGQDLHDGLCQHLTGTAFACKVLEEQLRARAVPEADNAAEISELIDEAIAQARETARGLSPLSLAAPHGFEAALHELANGVQDVWGTPCAFQSNGPVTVPNATVAMHLYRIAQEAVNNAVRHGRPQRVTIALRNEDHQVQVRVTDDGVGLPAELPANGGLGLRIMQYRAKTIGATLDIRCGEPAGTAVTCTWPRPDSGAEA